MNQHADTCNQRGTWMATLSSLAGFVTLDRVYMITALAGLVIAIFGYLDKRRTEKLKRKEIEQNIRSEQERLKLDRIRAQAVLDYLNGSKDSPAVQRSPEVIGH